MKRIFPKKTRFPMQISSMRMMTYVAIMAVLIAANLLVYKVNASKINCAAFHSQIEAQQAFDGDTKLYARLDGSDNDKIVCETYPY